MHKYKIHSCQDSSSEWFKTKISDLHFFILNLFKLNLFYLGFVKDFKRTYFLYVMCISEWQYEHLWVLVSLEPEKGTGNPRVGVTDGSTNVSAGNSTQILCKSSKLFSLLNHLSNPYQWCFKAIYFGF